MPGLKNKDTGGLSLKVSEKGAVSLYGMGRFPVTLYKEQWARILANAPLIEAFIHEKRRQAQDEGVGSTPVPPMPAPELFQTVPCLRGVPDGVLNVPVAQVMLCRPGIGALAGQLRRGNSTYVNAECSPWNFDFA